MKSKSEMRKQLQAGMAMFLSQGKEVTKLKTYGTKRTPAKEKVVEIEVNFLPQALQQKFFSES